MCVFFFNDTATTEIYTLSLHDALPIYLLDRQRRAPLPVLYGQKPGISPPGKKLDRKSTRLNSSHANISYAVFCLKKKHAALSLCIVERQPSNLRLLHTCRGDEDASVVY